MPHKKKYCFDRLRDHLALLISVLVGATCLSLPVQYPHAALPPFSSSHTAPSTATTDTTVLAEQIKKAHVLPGMRAQLRFNQNPLPPPQAHHDAIAFNNQHIHHAIDHTKHTFFMPVQYLLVTFEQPVTLLLAHFKKKVNFASTHFTRTAEFTWTEYADNASFTHARFGQFAHFYQCIFHQDANFYRARFKKIADFSGTHFLGSTQFNQIDFYQDAHFQQAVFAHLAQFNRASFTQSANFEHAIFLQGVNFSDAHFQQSLILKGAQLEGKIQFYETTLPAYVDLSYAQFPRTEIDLTRIIHHANRPPIKINLTNTNVENVNLDYQHFQLYFPPSTPNREVIRVYENLLNVFEKKGLRDSYKALFREYQAYKYHTNGLWMTNLFQKYWWDYGFEKGRIFVWILVMTFVFSFINNCFYNQLVRNAYQVPFLLRRKDLDQKSANPFLIFLFRFPRTVLYTSMLFFGGLMGFQRSAMEFKSRNLLVNMYLMFIIITGLLCAMFILNFFIYQS